MTLWARVHLVAILFVLALLGCVAQEHRAMVAAQEAYAQCVREHSEAHPDCKVLKQHQLVEQRRYEQNARRAWSCDPAQEECPTRR